MQRVNGPVLVREHDLAQPGPVKRTPESRRRLIFLRTVLLILGLGGVGYYGYELANQHIYQVYENWAFDQQIGGRPQVTFADYIRERTPFGFLVGERTVGPAPVKPPVAPPADAQPVIRPVAGSILGRVEIGRLNLSAIVREGVDSGTLSRAVGHVPSTSLPGQSGNFAIAAHRDTLFRALKDIHDGDLIEFQSPAETYKYQVFSTRIVKPSDVGVLRPDGGDNSLKPSANRADALITMITCYPFYYVGSAPKRFIVQARLISNPTVPEKQTESAGNTAPLRQLRPSQNVVHAIKRKPKKHGLWRRLFHRS